MFGECASVLEACRVCDFKAAGQSSGGGDDSGNFQDMCWISPLLDPLSNWIVRFGQRLV